MRNALLNYVVSMSDRFVTVFEIGILFFPTTSHNSFGRIWYFAIVVYALRICQKAKNAVVCKPNITMINCRFYTTALKPHFDTIYYTRLLSKTIRREGMAPQKISPLFLSYDKYILDGTRAWQHLHK